MKLPGHLHFSSSARYLIFFFLLLLISCKPGKDEGTQEKPNIIFILADDLGYGDVHSFNAEGKIPTPNIDQLAANRNEIYGCTFQFSGLYPIALQHSYRHGIPGDQDYNMVFLAVIQNL